MPDDQLRRREYLFRLTTAITVGGVLLGASGATANTESEETMSGTKSGDDPKEAMARLQHAINAHDVEQVVACFSSDFRGEHPAHPERNFQGHHQIRTNWTGIFAAVPDITATVLHIATEDSVALVEWRWSGTSADGGIFNLGGVTIQEVSNGAIVWTRLYMEPIPPA